MAITAQCPVGEKGQVRGPVEVRVTASVHRAPKDDMTFPESTPGPHRLLHHQGLGPGGPRAAPTPPSSKLAVDTENRT